MISGKISIGQKYWVWSDLPKSSVCLTKYTTKEVTSMSKIVTIMTCQQFSTTTSGISRFKQIQAMYLTWHFALFMPFTCIMTQQDISWTFWIPLTVNTHIKQAMTKDCSYMKWTLKTYIAKQYSLIQPRWNVGAASRAHNIWFWGRLTITKAAAKPSSGKSSFSEENLHSLLRIFILQEWYWLAHRWLCTQAAECTGKKLGQESSNKLVCLFPVFHTNHTGCEPLPHARSEYQALKKFCVTYNNSCKTQIQYCVILLHGGQLEVPYLNHLVLDPQDFLKHVVRAQVFLTEYCIHRIRCTCMIVFTAILTRLAWVVIVTLVCCWC